MLEGLFSKLADLLVGKAVERTKAEQRAVDEESQRLALYHFPTCPFCLRVRCVLKKLKLDIELRDVRRVAEYRTELITQGGKSMVPCLRIQDREGNVRWMYESSNINRYLIERFGQRREGD